MNKKRILKRLVLLIFAILVVNVIAMKLYWYTSIWWFDMPMHFTGGFFLGLLGVYLFSLEEYTVISLYKIFLFVLAVGIGWEVFEILVNEISHGPFYILDTISDVFFDVSGGLSAILYLCQKK